MRDLLNKFYLKKAVLVFAFFGAMAGWISWSITTFMANQIKLGVFGLIFALITFSFFLAYSKGETSIQKFLFGALFVFLAIDLVEILFVYIEYFGIAYIIMASVILAVLLVTLVCHILQQSDHIGNAVSGIIAQFCGLLMVLWLAFVIIMIVDRTLIPSDVTFAIAFVLTSFMLICVETRIRKYKQTRADLINKNAWNDETKKETKELFKL